jgi:hypothetical protein
MPNLHHIIVIIFKLMSYYFSKLKMTLHSCTHTVLLILAANFVSRLLLQLFQFAQNHRGLYQYSVPSAVKFYASSDDEVADQ